MCTEWGVIPADKSRKPIISQCSGRPVSTDKVPSGYFMPMLVSVSCPSLIYTSVCVCVWSIEVAWEEGDLGIGRCTVVYNCRGQGESTVYGMSASSAKATTIPLTPTALSKLPRRRHKPLQKANS